MEKGAGMYLINLKKEIISEDMPLTDIQKMFKGLQDEELRNLVICLDKNHAEQFIRERIVVRGGKK
jgi:cytochrome c